MSKQKNKKFKKAKTKISETGPSAVSDNNQNLEMSISAKAITPDKYIDSAAEYTHVRKDIRVILLTILLLAVLIVAVYFLGNKTSILTNFGDWIYKILNLQTQ
ncbi:MAG: hypothetical protein WCO23_02005 [bacterium]